VRHAFAGYVLQSRKMMNLVLALWLALALMILSAAEASANPRYAAFVMDARTGQVLFARNADEPRFPASLTKMMTVYLMLEAIESGRVSKSTRIPISAKAAAEQPSKIGLRAGSTITVNDAILALVTKSANDIATASGEFLGGSEAGFARMMTAKARQLGMNSTTFRNAHGLPNSAQKTTARDMAILGIALREHFPQHYSYFSTRSATIAGNRYGNHNRLLGRIEGVDGIKTGYIRASGFNLVSSVQSNGRSIVAVVMGGQTGRSRDDHMAALIREHLPRASRGGGGPLLARHAPVAGGGAVAFALPSSEIPTPQFRPQDTFEPTAYVAASAATVPAMPAQAAAPQPAAVAAVPSAPVPQAPVPSAEVAALPLPERFGEQGSAPAIDPVQTSSTPRQSGWVVQIAATGSQGEAMALLSSTADRAPNLLGSATPFTETFEKGGTVYYRARFAGFPGKDAAWNTCNALKRQKIDCYAVEM
jgi:D-alanyl-D-alanine carboxypeptidase